MSDLQIFSEVEMLTIQATAFQTKAEAMVIESDEHVAGATNLLGFIAQSKKQFDERRTGIVKPLNDQVAEVNKAFKTITAPLDAATATLKDKVLTYRREQEKRRQEELARIERERKAAEELQSKLEEEHRAQRIEALLTTGELPFQEEVAPTLPVAPVELPPEISTNVKASLGSSTFKKVWTFEVIDPKQIPYCYLILDEKAIRSSIRQGVREIPGIRIYQDEQLSVSTKQ